MDLGPMIETHDIINLIIIITIGLVVLDMIWGKD